MSSKLVGKTFLKGALGVVLLSGVSLTALSTAAYAQDAAPAAAPADDTVVVVTGIRRSLRSSEEIKRNTQGVVDSITAEDIGKFPDTNLAESIQRIPGVTIDRNNNEGSRVTVRGFGPEYNLVTLNGRSMPGSITDSSQTATRSFDFANLSSDGIAGIDVYKTGRADVPSGGIGSTIDIRTARPFDYKGMKASFQVKATDDTSTEVGKKTTPELSGVFSNTFADGKVGFLVNGSYSERNSRQEESNIGGYLHLSHDIAGDNNDDLDHVHDIGGLTDHRSNKTGNVFAPQSEAWGFDDHQRTRLNGQAVLQFRPVDNLTATVDYTYALYKDHVQKHSFGAWFGYGGDLTSATINEEGNMTDIVDTGSDLSYSTFDDQLRNELKSTGLNVKWKASDNLDVTFDAHHSTTDSGAGPQGNNDFLIVGIDPIYSKSKVFHSGDSTIPTTTWTWQDPAAIAAYHAAHPDVTLHNTNPTSLDNLSSSMITPLFAQANTNSLVTTIDEERADAVWHNSNDDSGLKSIRFGFDAKKMQTHFKAYNSGNFALGYYDPHSEAMIPDSAFTKVNSCSILKGISGGGCDIAVPYFYTFNLKDAVAATSGPYNYKLAQSAAPTTDHHIQEQTNALYFILNFDTSFNGMRFKAQSGLRYETTDVTARSLQQVPDYVEWVNPTEFFTRYKSGSEFSKVKSKYSEFLPSVDASLDITKSFVVRGSYSKTLTRSDLTSLVGTQSVSSTPKPGARTVSAGNPALKPYESQNFDLTAEWYYTRDSYVSVNYFSKDVNNFLTQTTTKEPVDGLTDPMAGAIYNTARAEVIAGGMDPTVANIFARMQTDTGQSTFKGQPGDPLIQWDVTRPTNANEVNFHGFEFAVQHIFGDTGFGLQANLSLPAGGAKINDQIISSQFALPGLSKSYNLVGFYEKHGFQGRVAYTHRGEFLAALSQGQGANEPQYVEAYGQLDASASYDVNDQVSVFFDGINLTNQNQIVRGRFKDQFLGAFKGNARYQVGVRYKF